MERKALQPIANPECVKCGEEEWEVASVKDHRLVRKHGSYRLEYKVKWCPDKRTGKKYPAQWVAAADCDNCEELVDLHWFVATRTRTNRKVVPILREALEDRDKVAHYFPRINPNMPATRSNCQPLLTPLAVIQAKLAKLLEHLNVRGPRARKRNKMKR